MMSKGSMPADHADRVLAVGREDRVLSSGGSAGSDLGGLLAVARDPERQLTLALEVARLGVESAHGHHVAIEPLVIGLGQPLESRQESLSRLGGRERAVRGQHANCVQGADVVFVEFRGQIRLGSP